MPTMAPASSSTAMRTVPVPSKGSVAATVRVPVSVFGAGKLTPVLCVALKLSRTARASVSSCSASLSRVPSRMSSRPLRRPVSTLPSTASLVPPLTNTSPLPLGSPVAASIGTMVMGLNTASPLTVAAGV